jgi:hypothetical protein
VCAARCHRPTTTTTTTHAAATPPRPAPRAQSAPTPPDNWLWRNVYMDNANVELRTVAGELVHPIYDPSYAS